MTDHKFTDDDVIKAYELCFTPKGTNETCAKCPFHKIGLLCKIKRDRAALDLINRQKAEIERLQAVHADMTESLRLAAEANKDMQAEIETLGRDRYQVIPDGRLELLPRTDINAIKAEAIKEFAQRLKRRASMPLGTLYGGMVYLKDIDNIVKIMTEDNNESQNT